MANYANNNLVSLFEIVLCLVTHWPPEGARQLFVSVSDATYDIKHNNNLRQVVLVSLGFVALGRVPLAIQVQRRKVR